MNLAPLPNSPDSYADRNQPTVPRWQHAGGASVGRRFLALCAAWLAAAAAACVQSAQFEAAWQAKVDPGLWQAAQQGKPDFFVVLAEQADVRGARTLHRKEDKVRFVFQTLSATAERTQQPLRAVLLAGGHACRSFWIVNAVWTRGDAGLVSQLAQRDEVLRLLPNPSFHFTAPEIAADTFIPVLPSSRETIEWNVTKVGAPLVWPLGWDGQGVVIGGQDTGYQWDHPALKTHYRGWDGTNADHNYHWHDAVHGSDPHNTNANPCGYNLSAPCDDDGHGTHTMGSMVGDDGGANRLGLAPGAKWIACRNMEQGWGTPATYTECFQWFVAPTDLNNEHPDPARAPDVINNSWGCPAAEGCLDPFVHQTIIENVRAAGIVVVVSAGNSGSGCSTVRESPAIYDAAFSIGATDSQDRIASFSGRGPVTVDGSGRMKPDLSAPGVSVRSSYPVNGYAIASGTSMAGPQVAGAVALLISAHPELRGDVEAIETLLRLSALPRTNTSQTCGGIPPTQVPNNTFGWGRLDVLAALGWQDSDGDGATDFAEVLAGTDPRSPASVLRITEVVLTNDTATIRFTSATNKLYQLEAKTAFADSQWSVVATNVPGTGQGVTVTEPLVPDHGTRLYRVRLVH